MTMKKAVRLFLIGSLFSSLVAEGHPLDKVYRETAGAPAAKAEATVLLRRMSLQLKGEIPSVSEVSAIADNNFQSAHWAAF